MRADLPRGLKLATVWLLIGTALFLAVQAWQEREQRMRFQAVGMGVAELRRAPDGHFHWPGRVNGAPVDFLVDTGATRTALPGALAERLRLPVGPRLRSSTAGGEVTGHESVIDLALDGGPQVQRLRVTVLPALASPLLGMDVLGRLRFTQHDGVLRVEPAAGPR